jgi:hypothetical protein
MFTCERCGSSYSASHIGVEHCPRCQLRDRVQAPLSFKVFKLPDMRSSMEPVQSRQPTPPQPVAAAEETRFADVP